MSKNFMPCLIIALFFPMIACSQESLTDPIVPYDPTPEVPRPPIPTAPPPRPPIPTAPPPRGVRPLIPLPRPTGVRPLDTRRPLTQPRLDGFIGPTSYYPNPGIVAFRDGQWVGSDHLYNLSSRIDVVVEIFKPENSVIPIKEGAIRERIVDIFDNARIEAVADQVAGRPPTPFFHMLIMVHPIENGFVACCEGRLFEQVKLDRIILDEQTVMQAITWESTNLLVAPENDLEIQVDKSVDEITNTFVDRFLFYDNIRVQIRR